MTGIMIGAEVGNVIECDVKIRLHAHDVYLGMCVSYLSVLARFGETSQTVAKKNN